MKRASDPDITNERFGSIVAIQPCGWAKRDDGSRVTTWMCRCDCGARIVTDAKSLESGGTCRQCKT